VQLGLNLALHILCVVLWVCVLVCVCVRVRVCVRGSLPLHRGVGVEALHYCTHVSDHDVAQLAQNCCYHSSH
jgi:hypothetical protein